MTRRELLRLVLLGLVLHAVVWTVVGAVVIWALS